MHTYIVLWLCRIMSHKYRIGLNEFVFLMILFSKYFQSYYFIVKKVKANVIDPFSILLFVTRNLPAFQAPYVRINME